MSEEKKQARKNNNKMRTLWVSAKNIKKLRKLRLIDKEPDDSVLERLINRIEKVGMDD